MKGLKEYLDEGAWVVPQYPGTDGCEWAEKLTDEAKALFADLTRLRDQRDMAMAVVRRLEWRDDGYQEPPYCPLCHQYKAVSPRYPGHKDDCVIRALLDEINAEQEG